MALGVAARDEVEGRLARTHTRHLAVDLALGRDHVAEVAPALLGQPIGQHLVQEGSCTAALDDKLGKRAHVSYASVGVDALHFPCDCLVPVSSAEGWLVVVSLLRVEPVGRLPPAVETKLGTLLLQTLVDGCGALGQRPPGHALLIGIDNDVVEAVRLANLGVGEGRRRPVAISSGVGLEQLVWRLALQDPVDQVLAGTGAVCDAVAEATGRIVVFLIGNRSEESVAVGWP
mmetsp:Transcript_40074/g.100272  ORF Transcript_40074/g.100272 Transcript_40074/m.100272 type:complete len:231 (-) Transcript_40074:1326-2018(-)